MRNRFCFLFLFAISFAIHTTAQSPGDVIYYEQVANDDREYIEYIVGNLPIIISAPHGGVKLSGQTIGGVFYPDNDSALPDRTCGVNERDDNTDILIREIQANIFSITGCYAHVIINNLHRSKLDPNREINEAACGDSDAEDHWTAFHDFVDVASATVTSQWGKGLYIDLHGQSHAIPRIEIGYNITAEELNTGNLNASGIVNKSSIKNLTATNITGVDHENLTRGLSSIGEFFQEAAGTFYASNNYPGCTHNGTNGYRALPSATDTGNSTCDDTRPYNNPYFDGDFYNNRRHGSGPTAEDGSGGGGTVDGIMIEVNRRVRDLGTYNGVFYDNRPQTLVPFAGDFAQVVLDFIALHYGDYAAIDYGGCVFRMTDADPLPDVHISGGVFTGDSGLVIDSITGSVDLSESSVGEHEVTHTVGDCGLYSATTTIEISEKAKIYVDLSAEGNMTGGSWSNAYTSIEDALLSSCFFDTIFVAEGTYIPDTLDRSYVFPWQSSMVIQGGYSMGGIVHNPLIYETVISGDVGQIGDSNDNLYHVLDIGSEIVGLSFVDLTISHGFSDGTGRDDKGAAIFNHGSITLNGVIVRDNASGSSNEIVVNQGTLILLGDVQCIGNM